eukprot:g42588.t1
MPFFKLSPAGEFCNMYRERKLKTESGVLTIGMQRRQLQIAVEEPSAAPPAGRKRRKCCQAHWLSCCWPLSSRYCLLLCFTCLILLQLVRFILPAHILKALEFGYSLVLSYKFYLLHTSRKDYVQLLRKFQYPLAANHTFKHRLCVLHSSVGSVHNTLPRQILQSKQRWAERQGYRLLVRQQSEAEPLIENLCVAWSVWQQRAFHSNFHVQIKYCTLLHVFHQEDCAWVMWTDSDALLTNSDFPLPELLWHNPQPRQQEVDIIWSAHSNNCSDPSAFYPSLNTGLFFIRYSPFSLQFLQHILSYGNYSFSTAAWGYEQCLWLWHGDQCAALGVSAENPQFYPHYQCTNRSGAALMQVVTAAQCGEGFSAQQRTELRQSLLLNCAGEQEHLCVQCLLNLTGMSEPPLSQLRLSH